MADKPFNNAGAFVPTTEVYDANIIYSLNINSHEFKDFLVKLRQSVNNLALVLNIKESGYFPLTEFVNGKLFFPNPSLSLSGPQTPRERQVFRKTVNFGALPNTATTSVAHGVDFTSTYSLVSVIAAASDQTGLNYIPIPYVSVAGGTEIEISVDATNINITTASNRSAFTVCYVVLEYLKN